MKWKVLSYSAILLWLFSSHCIILSSCASTRIVTVPEYHEVVVHQRDTTSQRDSIFIQDSICITHWGDTILQKEYHVIYRDRWRDHLRIDSFIQRDTLTVVKEVEKPPNRWQQTKMRLGSTLLWLLSAAIVFFLACAIIYRYKRG